MNSLNHYPHALRGATSSLFALSLLLTACGGGSSEPTPGPAAGAPEPSVPAGQSQIFAKSVAGIGVVGKGETDSAGQVPTQPNEPLTFYLGSAENPVKVAKATAAPVVEPSDLKPVAATAPGEDFLPNVLALLGVLDQDQNGSNGIVISDQVNEAIAQRVRDESWSLDFNVKREQFVAAPGLADLLAALDRSPTDLLQQYANQNVAFAQGRSSTLALTSDDRYLVVVNRASHSVSLLEVRDSNGKDVSEKIAEIPVDNDPQFIALSPDDRYAFVTHGRDGTLSVIDLARHAVANSGITVGTEPRGVVVSPNGNYVFVANHTEGSVSVLRSTTLRVINRVPVGAQPYALAVTNDGDRDDQDETVYVTQFFGRLIEGRVDGFNDAKEGVISAFPVADALSGRVAVREITLQPLDSGFAADRRQYCLNTRQALQQAGNVKFFNSGVDGTGDGAAQLANETFCPDVNSQDASDGGPIANVPQKAYPNQLHAALIRGAEVYLPNIAASPEPPVKFNVNIQAMVGVVNVFNGEDRSINLNAQIKAETQPAQPAGSLVRTFANDVVALDANRDGTQFLFVSRGGNHLILASRDEQGALSLGAPGQVVRFATGNLPNGVVMSADGRRAYTNNEVSLSVTAVDLDQRAVLAQDIPSSEPPAPGTPRHRQLVGQLAFFTALGIPDVLDRDGDGSFDIALRNIDPLQFRNRASDNGWSGCGSCHPDGHSDNVTWIFATGPRKTLPLEGMFARGDQSDQRVLNWSGVQGSITDFNNNARGVQGGVGFASDVNGENRSAQAFNHGPTRGVSDALDAMTDWVATAVRAPTMPDPADTRQYAQGRAVFVSHCASCHGGVKWTKSRTSPVYNNDPTFEADPLGPNFFAQNKQPPHDARVTAAGPQIVRVTDPIAGTLNLLDNVGTFDSKGVLELRGTGAIGGGLLSIAGDPNLGVDVPKQSTQGFAALGAAGFNTPSLLGVAYHAPYLHDGSAPTLAEVYERHTLPDANTATPDPLIEQVVNSTDRTALTVFLESIDDDTAPVESAADVFLRDLPRANK